MQKRNNENTLLWGGMFLTLGILLVGNIVGFWYVDVPYLLFYKGFWTIFVLLPCVVSIVKDGPHLATITAIVVSGMILMAKLGYLDFRTFRRMLLPILLIIVGMSFFIGYFFSPAEEEGEEENAEQEESAVQSASGENATVIPNGENAGRGEATNSQSGETATVQIGEAVGRVEAASLQSGEVAYQEVFGGQNGAPVYNPMHQAAVVQNPERAIWYDSLPNTYEKAVSTFSCAFVGKSVNYDNRIFGGCKLQSVLGELHLNISQAKLAAKNISISCQAMIGNVDIHLPEECNVCVTGTPVLGGLHNYRKQTSTKENLPTITIDVTCILGGVDIR